ncbi:hypothetical protein GCM10007913_22080 [Devosia yakushimensis]|uniref:DUF3168 domain-containing protein n=1 Tax=Devosia yakushimensis TaxID=470028 RepID=A0ABQ5UED5_9HYPH|nr:DUF3168 domain-containing protein [Devosia yakushimensis]GLQ10276.1 hypothetical protein GCM10007913_22080 [Devosia yakushimensis]
MHPIVALQGALVSALGSDAELVAIIGANGVFDAPPRGRAAPYVVIARHDVIQRDGDVAPGQEHRILVHCWGDQPSRRRALAIAERVVAVGLAVVVAGLVVSHAEHVRTDTVIDRDTGLARAAVTLRFLSEAAA